MRSPEVAYSARVAGNPSAMLQGDPDKTDLVSGNTISMDSGGTELNTNVQGVNKSESKEVNKSSTSGGSDAYKAAYAAAKAKGGQGTIFTFNNEKHVVKDAPVSTSSSSSNSSAPNVSTTKKTNVSIDNIASPKLSKLDAELAEIRHNNLVGEIKGISDSIATRQRFKNMATLGRLTPDVKAEVLNTTNNNNFVGPNEAKIEPGISKIGFSWVNNLGPYANDENFLDFVSGSAADEARAAVNSDKKPQNIAKHLVVDGRVAGRDQNRNSSPGGPSTEDATGYTYEEIKKKSGEKVMQMANSYFNRNR